MLLIQCTEGVVWIVDIRGCFTELERVIRLMYLWVRETEKTGRGKGNGVGKSSNTTWALYKLLNQRYIDFNLSINGYASLTKSTSCSLPQFSDL